MLCKAGYHRGYERAVGNGNAIIVLWEIKMERKSQEKYNKKFTESSGENPSGLLLRPLNFMCRLFCQILIIIIEILILIIERKIAQQKEVG